MPHENRITKHMLVQTLTSLIIFIHLFQYFIMNIKFRKTSLIILLIFSFSFRAFAPGNGLLVVINRGPIEPFKHLVNAIGLVESFGDTLAYNPKEKAVGFFQIRPVRLEDYNKRTGNNFSLKDMFNYEISEKIFLYYASQIGPANFEKIARNWNGSGPRTIYYWKRVKKLL